MAFELATFGEQLSLYGLACKPFFNIHWLLKNMKTDRIESLLSKTGTSREELIREAQKKFDQMKSQLSEIFITALLNHDRETIVGLADAAEFFRGKIGFDKAADPLRSKLMLLKMTPQIHKGMRIREIANFVYGKDHKFRDNSRLRQICKELGLPIKPSRPLSRKVRAKRS